MLWNAASRNLWSVMTSPHAVRVSHDGVTVVIMRIANDAAVGLKTLSQPIVFAECQQPLTAVCLPQCGLMLCTMPDSTCKAECRLFRDKPKLLKQGEGALTLHHAVRKLTYQRYDSSWMQAINRATWCLLTIQPLMPESSVAYLTGLEVSSEK